jgi:hypothetical protein
MVVPCGCGCSTVVTLLTYGFVGSANAIDGKYGPFDAAQDRN